MDYGGGRVLAFGYDDLGRPTSDTLTNAGGATVAAMTYGYDLNDHVTGKKTTGLGGAQDNTYAYDHAGRLTSWTHDGVTVEYGWDASGNRVRAGNKTATYDARNRLLSDDDHTYSYSARGTLAGWTSSGLTERFTFDAFDRLISAGSAGYAYDSLDRVASRGSRTFTYAGLGDDVTSDGETRYARDSGGDVLGVE
ncbi:hypothetical protein ACFQ08_43940, partial [Streptosporangium algeriense]